MNTVSVQTQTCARWLLTKAILVYQGGDWGMAVRTSLFELSSTTYELLEFLLR